MSDYHRWYDPATGKWLGEDPLTFAAGDMDLTRYVRNAPTDSEDPIGLKPPPDPVEDLDEIAAKIQAQQQLKQQQIMAGVIMAAQAMQQAMQVAAQKVLTDALKAAKAQESNYEYQNAELIEAQQSAKDMKEYEKIQKKIDALTQKEEWLEWWLHHLQELGGQ